MLSKVTRLIDTKRDIIKDVFVLSISKYFKQGTIFIKGLLLASVLTVEDFGIYSLFMLFITFSVFISLGSTYALNKQLSINHTDLIQRGLTIRRSQLILVSSNILFFILFIIIALNIQTVFNHGIIIVYLSLILKQYNIFYENILRAFQEFKKISIGLFLVAFIDLLLILAFIGKININLIITFYLIAVLLSNLFYRFATKEITRESLSPLKKSHFTESKMALYNHFILGISLLLYNLNYLLFLNTDKIIVSSFFGIEKLGVYTFATNIVAGTMILLQGINYIMYPKLLKKFSVIDSSRSALILYKKIIFLLIPSLLVINTCIFFVSSIFIRNLYVEYIDGIIIILILYIGQIFNVVTMYSNTISIAQNKESFLIKIQLLSLGLNIILGVLFLNFGLAFYYIAVATVLSQMFLCVLSVINTFSVIKHNGKNKH
ncbi:hypothetical protein LGQ02_19510 [Bacillus shivajii]|uniref:oligosaccharide flippase family protein n=1 Tax=Bacillus shivajii TaxID=1983719 RepID=UPI001CFB1A5A|nr:oligosaccharide flippase family protein [Bacillus shivajii]UCZ52941.1 hypothetical protein LGQ02_19510 [Bacillus shivajii]